jgi:DNA topoisomerase I
MSYDERNYNNGISRKKKGKKIVYYYIKNNKEVINNNVLKRIIKLRIPPAWKNVWISTNKNNNIQVVGTDNKGRKQYKYHEKHIKEAEKNKFIKLYDFIKSIPKLERTMSRHRRTKHVYSKESVIVTMLRVVKTVHMRVGKECYAKRNKSYGVSSLLKKHIKFNGNKIIFNFKGKSNKRLRYVINNKILKSHISILMKLKGDKLFQYIDYNETIRKVTDTDINQYIQRYMGPDFTCKDFRTYAANNYFIKSLLKETKKRLPKNDKVIKKNILTSLKHTAFYLKHTKAISKKSYVMNFTIEMYENDPEYFIERKYDHANTVLLDLIRLYKNKILNL